MAVEFMLSWVILFPFFFSDRNARVYLLKQYKKCKLYFTVLGSSYLSCITDQLVDCWILPLVEITFLQSNKWYKLEKDFLYNLLISFLS